MSYSNNSAFSKVVPKLQLAWDSVSLGAALTCPRYYELSIVEGYTTKLRAVDLEFGILAHSTRERYYHARAAGASHNDALDTALDYLLNATWDAKLQRPWTTNDPNKNRVTLVRSMIWYLDQWENDPLETVILANGKPAVELSFRFTTSFITDHGEPFIICGHLDRIAKFNNEIKLSDLKTTKHTLDDNYFDQFVPDNQFQLYSFAVKVVYQLPVTDLIVDAMQVAVTFTHFERRPIVQSEAQLDEWYADTGELLKRFERYARANYWPMNRKACFRCIFRKPVCSKSPAVREEWLKVSFDQRTWDPLQVRGDI